MAPGAVDGVRARISPQQRQSLPRTMPTIAVLVAIALLYWPTLRSLVATWASSGTYNHCFLIPLISLWLGWLVRNEVASAPIRPSWFAAAALAVTSALWLVARHAGVQIGEHLALVAAIPLTVWAVNGRAVARVLLFPLAYLFFMVPFGDALIPYLMRLTADVTVGLLRLTGVATYREGMLFMVPSGVFEVAKACSGLRYLIASAALGTLYAHLVYRSRKKQALFVIVSLLVPLIANGLRAYMIVLIASLSDMRLAVGIDHFIYGWLFFGLVLGLMFVGGWRFRDALERSSSDAEPPRSARGQGVYAAAAAAAVLIGWGPAVMWVANDDSVREPSILMELPEVPAWEGPLTGAGFWAPDYPGASAQGAGSYWSSAPVHVFVAADATGRGAEFFSDANRLDRNLFWNELVKERIDLSSFGAVLETAVFGEERPMLVWAWYVVDGETETRETSARLAYLRSLWNPSPLPLGFVAVAVPLGDNREAARERLERFVADARPVLASAIAALGVAQR